MNKQLELIHQRNILMLKLVWTGLILDILVIAFLNVKHTLNIHVLVGVSLTAIISLVVRKKVFIKQIMYINVCLVFVFFFVLLYTDPLICNYLFIWFGLLLSSLYQNSRLMWFAGVLTVFQANYFFLTFRAIIFPGVDNIQLIFINLLTVLMVLILVMISRFSEKLRLRAEMNESAAVEYLESFINNTTDAIVAHDLSGRILLLNKAFEEMHGWPPGETPEQVLLTIPEDYLEETRSLWQKVQSGGQVSGFETRRLRKDKSEFLASVTISPIHNDKGDIVALACITRDITEKKETEEILRKSDKLTVVGQLAAGVAHEVRNPITVIKGFVQLLQLKALEKEESHDIILSEVERIESIINEFLLLAKPQQIKFKMQDFPELIQNLIKLVQAQAAMNKVSIHVTFEPGIPPVECDANQIKQVFINVLKNAIDAMPDGGEINISVAQAGEGMVITRVVDQGSGISAERIEKLGEPFFTSKEKGTGLGLMVSYKIIENHRGKINISSKVGQGTTVEILLPCTQNTNETSKGF